MSAHAVDFSPTREQISLHGLGFIQVKLPANRRLHVWHPDLPRRDCYQYSAIHNHRFSFRSTVLVGTQFNRRYNVIERQDGAGTHDRISHAGVRSNLGGRLSCVAGTADVEALPDEIYKPGQAYEMPVLQYHETPNSGVVVTLMEKLFEGTVHASSLIEQGREFHQAFDRLQLGPDALWGIVLAAMKAGNG